MNTDEYNEVINGEGTYTKIASELILNGKFAIGWTDEAMSHFDILFTYKVLSSGQFQGGITPRKDLFISIMRVGAFAFEINNIETSIDYLREKLTAGYAFNGATGDKFVELFNRVKKGLYNYEKVTL